MKIKLRDKFNRWKRRGSLIDQDIDLMYNVPSFENKLVIIGGPKEKENGEEE